MYFMWQQWFPHHPAHEVYDQASSRIHSGHVMSEGFLFYLMPIEKHPSYISVQQTRKNLKESLVYWINRAIPYCSLETCLSRQTLVMNFPSVAAVIAACYQWFIWKRGRKLIYNFLHKSVKAGILHFMNKLKVKCNEW